MIDSHNHTDFSEDCFIPLETMIDAAISKGIKHYTITDHLDLDYQDKRFTFALDHAQRKAAIRQAQLKYKDHINIYLGLECGVQPHVLEEVEDIIRQEAFDFVIASMHTTHKKDLYTKDFYQGLTPIQAYKAYLKEFAFCLDLMNEYDVVGHLDIVKRYEPSLQSVQLSEVEEEIIYLLKIIIRKNKGLEINTSGYNDPFNHAFPHPQILKWYYELGGRIITLGSDAHFPERIAQHYEKALTMLESIGFEHITLFKNRRPHTILLSDIKEAWLLTESNI
ncbi:MAG: histidinol-phosphatase HisJ family protein [Erysipelothrix sp.]|nr:histidinol-phosphatase HisJ family protein [Erysipelothrix sp.]